MPFLGALLAELSIFARKNIMNAFRAGSGAALGMLAGLLLEFYLRPAHHRLVLFLLLPVLMPRPAEVSGRKKQTFFCC